MPKTLKEALSLKARPSQRSQAEFEQHVMLANWLFAQRGLVWCHVPNGGARHVIVASKLKAMGTRRGVPDILIFGPLPQRIYDCRGVAIEMKSGTGRLAADQKAWMQELENCGWLCFVRHSAMDAIDNLKALGFGREAS